MIRIGVLSCLVLTAGAGECAGSPAQIDGPSFDVSRQEVGSRPAYVVSLDANRDRNLDLVVATTGDDAIVVLLGDGTGAFREAATVPAGENPVGLAAGDLDEDGWTDLVVANHETDYVTLLFGSSGGFESREPTRIEVDVSPHPHVVEAVDVDRDGHLDFLVDDRRPGAVRLYRGRGDGTFAEPRSIAVGGDPYRGMALNDLDGDGNVDLLTPNPAAVAVLLGDGTGGFSSETELRASGLRPFSVAVGDVNGDGFGDVAAGSGEGDGAIAVWFGSADGTFTPDPGSPYPVARGPTRLVASDVDGDGIVDFLTPSYVGNELAILLGGARKRRPIRMEVDGNPWGISTGDFDGDGWTDIVTSNDGSDDISIFLSRGE